MGAGGCPEGMDTCRPAVGDLSIDDWRHKGVTVLGNLQNMAVTCFLAWVCAATKLFLAMFSLEEGKILLPFASPPCKEFAPRNTPPSGQGLCLFVYAYLSGTPGFMPTQSVFRGWCLCCLICACGVSQRGGYVGIFPICWHGYADVPCGGVAFTPPGTLHTPAPISAQTGRLIC